MDIKMKKMLLACFLVLGMISLSLSFDKNNLITLKETGNCAGCDLQNFDLGGLNLKGANLEEKVLR